MSKIVVIGGTGEMGRQVVRDLLQYGIGYEVVATGRRHLSALTRYLQQAGLNGAGHRVSLARLDLEDLKAIDEVVAEARVVVNCSGPYYRLAERLIVAALKAGCHYVDLADEVDAIKRLLSYHPLAEARGITAVVGIGWTPGLTNIAARAGAERLQPVEAIRIYWAGSAADSPGPAVIEHVLHVVLGNTWQYEAGQWVKRRAMDGRARVTLPLPFGSLDTFYIAHPEPVTIPRSLPGVKNVEVRGAIMPSIVKSMIGFIEKTKIANGERREVWLASAMRRLLPLINLLGRETAVGASAFTVEVEGMRDGRRVCLTYSATDSMARLTALPCSICALMLADGEIDQPGVHSPEGIVPVDRMFEELAKRRLLIEMHETVN